MSIEKDKKTELVRSFGRNENDSGSPNVQVAILSERIKNLTEHLKQHSKDFATRRGLLTMVGKRKKLLEYIKKKNTGNYSSLIEKLGIRK